MEQAKARPVVRFLRRLLGFCAYAYPLFLLAVCALLTMLGEGYWVTAGLLYVPRVLYAAPLLVLVPALWLTKRRRLLWTQAAALVLVVFPLMGLVLPWPSGDAKGPKLKLMSFNVDSAHYGSERVLAAVDREQPDLVLFQESPWGGPLHDGLRARFPHVDASTQFLLASRYPIVERTEPAKVPTTDRLRSPRFMRYVVQTSLGKLAVYSLHPISPRGALGIQRFRGMFHRMRTGAVLEGDPEGDLEKNAELRSKQVAAAAAMAEKESLPVLLAGDTNLPGLSAALRRHFSRYTDGFSSASSGFGYTYPAKRPFLRIDRVMAGPELGFASFRVGCPETSDHLCVVAELFRR
jgi:endonuclease/exonuclease/phosphatase family metal-dependent hydrolase